MIKKIAKYFDTSRLITVGEIILILAILVVIVNLLNKNKSYSRYETNSSVSAEASVAFFVVDQGTYESSISLTGLKPSPDPLYYTFYVTNYNIEKRAEVDLQYSVTFKTTTNLPLSYEIVRNESFNDENYTNIIPSSSLSIIRDDYDVYYKQYVNTDVRTFLHTSSMKDEYVLKITFPESYKDSPDSYQGVIELFSIIIDASQVA